MSDQYGKEWTAFNRLNGEWGLFKRGASQEEAEAAANALRHAMTMPRPSTGHPEVPAEHRCNICGGLVHFDGTPPVKGCWGGRE